MIFQTINFDNASNFDLENMVIAFGLAKLALIPNPSQVFAQDFASASGFTYDNTKAEFVSGVLRQKNQMPVNSVVGGTFTSSKNLSWSSANGSLAVTEQGSPTLLPGKISLIGNNVSARYSNNEIGSIGSQFTLKFKITPSFNGSPLPGADIIGLNPSSGTANRFGIFISQGAGFRVTIFNNLGANVFEADIGSINLNQDQQYEIEINCDTQAGHFNVLLDGVLFAGGNFTPFTRGVTATTLCLGDWDYGNYSNHSIGDVVVFSDTQHGNSGYSPGYSLHEAAYEASSVSLPAFSYTGIGTILAVESSIVTESGSPRFIVAGRYFNGSSWVSSNGSYAQANTSAQVIANLTSLVVTGATSFVVSVVFMDSNTQSIVDLVSVTVTGQKYSPTGAIEPIQGIAVQDLFSIDQESSNTAGAFVQIQIRVDGVLKYWNGSAWVNSNGTFAQSNTVTDVNTNIAGLNFSNNSEVFIRWVFSTSADNETATITSAEIGYDFGALQTAPSTCLVYGYYKDIAGEPVQGASVAFSLVKKSGSYNEANRNIIERGVTILTDQNGYFETELIRSSEFEGSEVRYKVTITKDAESLSTKQDAASAALTFAVPDAAEKDLTDLLTMA